VICVTVGTHDQPFTRLIDALALLPAGELVVQYGTAHAPAGAALAARLMPYHELVVHLADARAVVTHAGVGSVLAAIAAGHTPVVVPRLRRFGEHVDDHQLEFALALGRRGDVIPLLDVARLPEAVAAAPLRRLGEPVAEGPLHAALRETLLGPGRRAAVRPRGRRRRAGEEVRRTSGRRRLIRS
jgi:UDP-N-acetylglucosamine transferase subunit ALG13